MTEKNGGSRVFFGVCGRGVVWKVGGIIGCVGVSSEKAKGELTTSCNRSEGLMVIEVDDGAEGRLICTDEFVRFKCTRSLESSRLIAHSQARPTICSKRKLKHKTDHCPRFGLNFGSRRKIDLVALCVVEMPSNDEHERDGLFSKVTQIEALFFQSTHTQKNQVSCHVFE